MREIFGSGRIGLSVEIFPPKSADGDQNLRQTLAELTPFQPAFVSVTYGAGGSTRTRTLDWCVEIQEQHRVPSTAHFTCVGMTRDELQGWLQSAWDRGIRNIMALRGDPVQGQEQFQAVAGGLKHAAQLVALIRDHFPEMGIGVAGYPEKHPEAADLHTDLIHLKHKVACGADAVFTQLFYDNDAFYRFWDQALDHGITVPIVPGVMPITEFSRIQKITKMSGTRVPESLMSRLEAAQHDKTAQFEIGVEFAVEQCRDLLAHGVPGVHFYVLNKSQACRRILGALGLEAATSGAT